MVQFDNRQWQAKIKIVYYGPALGGKTTCLKAIHKAIDPQRRTKLYSLNTASDRTLFFDLLSLDLGRIRGYRLMLQLYTVPGQVQYTATRKAVLSGADGVVFVADSQTTRAEANGNSLEDLWENLAFNGLDRETIPLGVHFNKRDLGDVLPIDEMEAMLNPRGVPSFPSVALTGEGVMECFSDICLRTLESVAGRLGVGGNPQAIRRLQDQARNALRPFVGDSRALGDDEGDSEVTTPSFSTSPTEPLKNDDLVGEAVRANLAMTDLNANLDTVKKQLQRKVKVLDGICVFAQELTSLRDPAAMLKDLLRSTIRLLEVPAAAISMVTGNGPLREAVVHGLKRDPLLSTVDTSGRPLAAAVVEENQPLLIAPEIDEREDLPFIEAIREAGYGSAVAVPMIAQGRTVGLLTAFMSEHRPALGNDDLQLASGLAASGAMGYVNAQAWRRLEDLNRGLETQVEARTAGLQQKIENLNQKGLACQEKNRGLQRLSSSLTLVDRIRRALLDRYLGAVDAERDRLAPMIKAASDRLDLGIDTPFETVSVGRIVESAMNEVKELAASSNVKLGIAAVSGPDQLRCKPKSCIAALASVIDNAVRFNRPGGAVKLEVAGLEKEGRQTVVIKVLDSGIGIAEQELKTVFEPCLAARVGGSHDTRVGAGLAIAQALVQSNGGKILIRSWLGRGTEVSVALPVGS
jgi:signal transduction histidine kinase/signal recognition particle receptor subunit beta